MPDQTPSMPPLPVVDLRMQIPYESIRYVAGFTEEYVKQYAVAYAQAVADERVRALEADAARYRWLRDGAWDPLSSGWLVANDLYGGQSEDLDAYIDAAISTLSLAGKEREHD